MPLWTVFSQRGYPGAGDVDDCWVVATVRAKLASDPTAVKPTVPEFRKKAGDPDDGTRDGGSLDEVWRGTVGTWGAAGSFKYQDPDWPKFMDYLRSGWIASLAVWSARLPAAMRFSFLRAHQVTVFMDGGTIYLLNPLAREGSPPLPITEAQLRPAARAPELGYPYREVRAVLFEPPKGDDSVINYIAKGAIVAGVFRNGPSEVITYPLDGGPKRGTLPAQAVRHGLGTFGLADLAGRDVILIQEKGELVFVDKRADSFTPLSTAAVDTTALFNQGVEAAAAAALKAKR